MAEKKRILGLTPFSAFLVVIIAAGMAVVHFYPVENPAAPAGQNAANYADAGAQGDATVSRTAVSGTSSGASAADSPEQRIAGAESGVPSQTGAQTSMMMPVEWVPVEPAEEEAAQPLSLGEKEKAAEQLRQLGLTDEEITSGTASLGFRYNGPPLPEENASVIEENPPAPDETNNSGGKIEKEPKIGE